MSNTEAFNKDIYDIITRYISGDKSGLEESYTYSYYPEVRDKIRYSKRDSKYEPTYEDIKDNMPFFSGNYWNVALGDLNDEGIRRIIEGLKYKHKDLDFDSTEVSDKVSALRKFLEENNATLSSNPYKRRRQREQIQKGVDELFKVQETPVTYADVHQSQNMWEGSEFPALSRLPSYVPNENLTPEDREAIIKSMKKDTAKNVSDNFTDVNRDKFFEDTFNEYLQSDTHKNNARAMGWSW